MLAIFYCIYCIVVVLYYVELVGGRSGGILNEHLLDEFKLAAKEHADKILFVYMDGMKHADQMRSLGLFGGAERLPSLAFNTRDNAQVLSVYMNDAGFLLFYSYINTSFIHFIYHHHYA